MEKFLNTIWPDVHFLNGENSVKCVFHDDTVSSAHIKLSDDKVLFHCKVCDTGYNAATLASEYYKITTINATKLIAQLNTSQTMFDWKKRMDALEIRPENKNILKNFGVTDEQITQLKLGYMGGGISFPIFLGDSIVDIRTYNPNSMPKVRSMAGTHTGYLYPQSAFKKKSIVLVEGEKDMIVARSHGINAATIIGGAMALPDKTTSWFHNRVVTILYDNDEAGKLGAQKVARFLLTNPDIDVEVRIANISPMVEDKKTGDLTDYFMRNGSNTPDLVEKCLKRAKKMTLGTLAPVTTHKLKTKRIDFHQTDAHMNEWLTSKVQVNATFDAPYTIPKTVSYIKGGQRLWTFEPERNIEHLIELIDSKSDRNLKNLLKLVTVNGDKILETARQRTPIFKAIVCATTDEKAKTELQQIDYSAYAVDINLQSGREYEIVYKAIPDPYDGNKTVVLILSAVDLTEQASNLTITKSVKESLDEANKYTFKELIEKSKGTINANFNNKLIAGIELAFHSVLAFNLGRYKDIKGTIDTIVITDTAFGKSMTTSALLKAYGSGTRVSLAGTAATPTGLIGGSKPVGKGFQTTAGVIPRNHKGIVILEELAKNNGSIMKDLTDIRTSGVAEIVRVSGKITLPANVRTAFLSNPKSDKSGSNKTVDSYPNGIEIIQDLLGAKEDIGRFDLAIVLGQRESVPESYLWKPETPLALKVLRDKLRWVWTRRADQIEYEEGVEALMMDQVKLLNNDFESDEQLFGRKTWMKLAKICIAIAGYTGSHSNDYTKILVKKIHVDDAVDLLRSIYDNPTFKLKEYVKEENAYTKPDTGSTKMLTRMYQAQNQIITQLEKVSEISSMELRTVSALTNEEFNTAVSDLTRARLIRNNKGKILPTEKFRKTIETARKSKGLVPPTLEEQEMK